jgi:hypothetical protein
MQTHEQDVSLTKEVVLTQLRVRHETQLTVKGTGRLLNPHAPPSSEKTVVISAIRNDVRLK